MLLPETTNLWLKLSGYGLSVWQQWAVSLPLYADYSLNDIIFSSDKQLNAKNNNYTILLPVWEFNFDRIHLSWVGADHS